MSVLAEVERRIDDRHASGRSCTAEEMAELQAIVEEHTPAVVEEPAHVQPAHVLLLKPVPFPGGDVDVDPEEWAEIANEQVELNEAWLEHEGYDIADFRPQRPRPVFVAPVLRRPQTPRPRARSPRARVVRRIRRLVQRARSPGSDDPSEPEPPLGGGSHRYLGGR